MYVYTYIDSMPPRCTYGDIKLVGGRFDIEGRVELCGHNYRWGTICDSGFGDKEADVVCRQLGYPYLGSNPQL